MHRLLISTVLHIDVAAADPILGIVMCQRMCSNPFLGKGRKFGFVLSPPLLLVDR
jgi:hypothetical protein